MRCWLSDRLNIVLVLTDLFLYHSMAFSASKSVLRRRFIVDTDVGVDDLVAIRSLLLHLNQEQQQDNLLLSAVHGMSETHVGASYLQRISSSDGTGVSIDTAARESHCSSMAHGLSSWL